MTIPQSGSPSFAHSLQQLMQDFRISNVTLARLSGCDASTISRYRSGRRQPPRPGNGAAFAGGPLVRQEVCRVRDWVISAGRIHRPLAARAT